MIKIVSDGTSAGTRVFQADGTEIKGIVAIEWEISALNKNLAQATLIFDDVHVEIAGELVHNG